MMEIGREGSRPGRGPVLASVVLHVAVAAVAWWAHRQAAEPIEFIAYEMELVSFAQDEAPAFPEDELVVETPEEPAPPEPEPEPEPPPPEPEPEPEEREPEPEPEPEPPPAERPRDEPRPAPPEDAERADELTSDEIAVRMEGLERDFPAYYSRIIREVDRCFRPPTGRNLTTVVRFDIQRDGSVPRRSISVHRSSGNLQFDVAAVGAVECAGAGRFGPLPDDLPWDLLPILFTFSPAGRP